VRVVFDTNIYVSAFAIPGGNAEEAYLQAVHGRFELFTSVAILTETAGVLQTKFDWAENRARQVGRCKPKADPPLTPHAFRSLLTLLRWPRFTFAHGATPFDTVGLLPFPYRQYVWDRHAASSEMTETTTYFPYQ
jgi:hypothetical protein